VTEPAGRAILEAGSISTLWAAASGSYEEICSALIEALDRRGVLEKLTSAGAARARAAVAEMREPLRDAAGGDAAVVLHRLGQLAAGLKDRDVSVADWLAITGAARDALQPILVRTCQERGFDLAAVLGGLERLILAATNLAADVLEAGHLEVERDALFLRSIVENIPHMIFVKDAADLRFVRFNRAGEELLGYSRADLIGRNDYDFFPGEEADFFTRKDRDVLQGRRLVDIPEEPIETRKRGRRFLHTKKIPILSEDGKPQFLLGISEDITERRQVREELERAKAAAEAASVAKSEFLARMSHEIRTPMNGIIGMTELALETDLTEEQREYLNLVHGSAESLLSVLNDVLDFSKIEAGKLDLESIPFEVREDMGQAVRSLALAAREKGLELSLQVDDAVPRTLLGDPLRLRQVLLNLVDNAIRFTQTGGVRVAVAMESLDADRGVLRVAVSDSGIGISESKQAVIFDAFTQGDGSVTREYGGTGLGLAICSRLVQMMGGEISLDSEPGRGSTFRFTAALRIPSAADLARRHVDTPAMAAPQLSPLRVLVAEDNLVNRTLTARILKRAGHHVEVALSGSGALEALRGRRFDVALMDLEMPGMGGIEATHRIREAERREGGHLPIIALTAHALRGDRERCLAAGMDGYLAKPIRRSALLGAIGAAVPGRGSAPRPPPPDAPETPCDDLFAMFRASCHSELRRIQAAVASGDAEALQLAAHGLAGSAATMQQDGIMQIAHRLVLLAREGDLGAAPQAGAELRSAIEALDHAAPSSAVRRNRP
jgi:PAS domain S-box-containing protein